MKNKVYKNLPYKRTFFLRAILIILIIELIAIFSLVYTNPLDISFKIMRVMLLFTISVYLTPLLILYFNYYNYNKSTALEISNNVIIYKSALKKRMFTFNEVAYIEFNLSYPLYENRWRLFFWDEYYYALIKLKSGEKFIITCLLCDELKEMIPASLIRKRRRVFPLVQLEEDVKSENKRIDKSIEFEKKVEVFMIKFKHKSELELQNIVKSENEYQSEAVQAAKKLLKLK